MSEGSQLNQTLPTLSEGNIVTIAAKMFMARGGTYFVASLLAHLWMYLAVFGVIIVLAIVGVITFFANNNNLPSVIGIVSVGLIFATPLIAFVWGRYLAAGGFVSRLIFNHLTHRDEPKETTREQTYPRVWAYFWSSICDGLFLAVIYGAIAAVLYVLWISLFPLLTLLWATLNDPRQSAFVSISLLLSSLVGILIIGLIIYYFTARLWFFDTILAIEERVGPLEAVLRSWQLTRNQGFKVMTVLFIATVVTAPPVIMASLINYVVPLASILLSVVVFPFWQAIKAVQYYDLGHRNEGLTFNLNLPPAQPRRFLQRVMLQTPESIELDFALGGIGSRAFAWVMDQTILFLSLALLWYVGSAIYGYVLLPLLPPDTIDDWNLWTFAIASFLTFVFTNGYYIGFETFWQGQTPGKRWARIRVIQDNGQPVGLKEAAIRSLMGLIDINFFFIGVVLVTFGKSEKRLGDFAAGTLIIQDETRPGQRQPTVQLRFGERAQTTAQDLIQSANLNALTADQYYILRDFLGYRTQLDASQRKQVTVNLATQLREIVAAPESPAALNILDEELLEAVYLACHQTIYKQV
ncbi:MAG: RDD family protein [Thermosynechococcaceae cyanobacterium]